MFVLLAPFWPRLTQQKWESLGRIIMSIDVNRKSTSSISSVWNLTMICPDRLHQRRVWPLWPLTRGCVEHVSSWLFKITSLSMWMRMYKYIVHNIQKYYIYIYIHIYIYIWHFTYVHMCICTLWQTWLKTLNDNHITIRINKVEYNIYIYIYVSICIYINIYIYIYIY